MPRHDDPETSAKTPTALLASLLDYILEQARHVDPRGFRLSAHRDFKAQRSQIAGLPGVVLQGGADEDPVWLQVARLTDAKPPGIPDKGQASLLTIPDEPTSAGPVVDDAAVLARAQALAQAAEVARGDSSQTPAPESVPLEQLTEQVRSEARSLLTAYQPLWKSWAEAEKPRRRTIALYGELFALSQRLADDTANPCELVWGIGIATWQLPVAGGHIPFEYPLITQELEVAVNDTNFTIELRPRATQPRLEIDAFVACDIPAAVPTERAVRGSWAAPNALPISPFVNASYSPALRSIANNLDKSGQYLEVKDSNSQVPTPVEALVVTDEWVILARPRRTNYLEEDIRRLKSNLADCSEVPDGPAALVKPPSTDPITFDPIYFRGLSSSGGAASGSHGSTHQSIRELYFPAPYNDEQVTIIQQLERAPGVTVQGPPGTGKTHTIANIICHYLATGRRVLVTSAGEPALRVLQNKIPEEVRPLTVALLSSDREGMKQFEASIRAIQQQVTQLDPRATKELIERASNAINLAHEEINKIDRRVDSLALAQLSGIEVDGVIMKPAKLAQLVVSGHATCGWFPDEVTLAPDHAPPITEEEAALLRSARRTLARDLVYVGMRVPVPDAFPPSAEIAKLHSILVRIASLDAQAQADGSRLKDLDESTLAAARQLLARLDEARQLAQELEARGADWALRLRRNLLLGSFASEREALESLFTELDHLIAERAAFLKRPVDFPDAGFTCPKTKEAVARAAQSGKPFSILAFGAGGAKQNIAAIKVAAIEPRSAEDWQHVQRYLDLHEKVLVASSRWNTVAALLEIPTFEGGVRALREIESIAQLARLSHRLAVDFDARLANEARNVLLGVSSNDYSGSSAIFERSYRALNNHLTRTELAGAAATRASLRSRLDGMAGPVVMELIDFVDNRLGDQGITPEAAAFAFDRLMSDVRRLAELTRPLSIVSDLSGRIERAGAPQLAHRVRTQICGDVGDDVVLPANWREAWNWTRIRVHLDSIEARSELTELATRRRSLEKALSRLYKDLVSTAAWLATKENATGAVMAALNGYATAMRRLGRGTGTNAARYRNDAREAMLEAADAVPCWIMSHARVSESMPARIGAFDLVIVDEASQSNLWALPAILRAKSILVVGDDKQVSPSAGFIEATRITELRERFLADQPYGVEMTPEKSLYDLAARVFAATQVMLREHFRSVPAIISYSNHQFYKGNIQPLRIAKGTERIDPPLVDLYIPSGYRDRSDVNDGEAQAIAAEIEAIIADERFAGRTLGVVTLMGAAQAKHIDAVVRRRCDPGELRRRNFEVGDAPTFQGSERDIIFLSLVVDPKNCHAVSGLTFEQRFNVAASRARDRMYLVRSIDASELSPADELRRSLLAHFDQPLVGHDEQVAELIDRCESGFERDVFAVLTGMGYQVMPQVPAGSYRIDMVVEGDGDRRLAIECDGDEFHGPDRWEADMRRQRVLERAGWTFWRCFASTWTLRRAEVLDELREVLDAMGIHPVGTLEKAPLLVERRVWEPPAKKGPETSPERDLLEEVVSATVLASVPALR